MQLNDRNDGPYGPTDPTLVQQYNAVAWLIECGDDNSEYHGGSWDSWDNATHLIETYEPAVDAHGKITTTMGNGDPEIADPMPIKIGERGLEILNGCIAGKDPAELMANWREEIFDQTHCSHRSSSAV